MEVEKGGSESKSAIEDCSNEQIEEWLDLLEGIYAKKKLKGFSTERPLIKTYLVALCKEFSGKYRLVNPISAGGSGIVFEAFNKKISEKLAVKFNRPIEDEDVRLMVKAEYEVLPKLDHPNIIRIIDRNVIASVSPELTYIVERLVSNAMNISEYLDLQLKPLEKKREPEELSEVFETETTLPRDVIILNEVLKNVAEIVLQWAKALRYVHGQGYVYLDVKPANALVEATGHVYLIDFGTALRFIPRERPVSVDEPEFDFENLVEKKEFLPLQGDELVNVFFSKPYAHPELRDRETHGTSSARVKAEGQPRSILETRFDYYALGMSLLEMLDSIVQKKKNDAPNLGTFRALHFIATRLLDGRNEEAPKKKDRLETKESSPIKQVFGDLGREDYENLKYTELDSVIQDLEKELGVWNIEKKIPELDTFGIDVVRVVPNLNTVLTKRLIRLIEHPLFGRLKNISQLGLVSLVYPTADHSRFDHVLGTYTYAANYIKSLFNDSQNPVFRNLVDEDDIKAALLCALLHDLGQFPLAHDLEEVSPRIFGHESLSISLLDDPTIDDNKETIAQIISDAENGWGIKPDRIKKILRAHSHASREGEAIESFKAQMLSAFIDGPIDADKVDYITRDTAQCRIPYGNQLDLERLLRVMTVAIIPEDISDYRVTIGVYEKGRASAEAVSLARYLLYSSVYWHHASRVLKTMLQYAVASSLPDEAFGKFETTKTIEIKNKLVLFRTNLAFTESWGQVSPMKGRKQGGKINLAENLSLQPMATRQEQRSNSGRTLTGNSMWYPGLGWGDWQMLNWLKRELPQPNEGAAGLIDSIMTRKLYKRLVTFDRIEDKQRKFVEQFDGLDWSEKLQLSRNLQKLVAKEVMKKFEDSVTRSISRKPEVARILKLDLALLVDIPNTKSKVKPGRPLMIVPELKEKTYFQETSKPYRAPDWTDEMMNSIAPLRVMCHRKLRQPIAGTLTPVRKTMKDLLQAALEAD